MKNTNTTHIKSLDKKLNLKGDKRIGHVNFRDLDYNEVNYTCLMFNGYQVFFERDLEILSVDNSFHELQFDTDFFLKADRPIERIEGYFMGDDRKLVRFVRPDNSFCYIQECFLNNLKKGNYTYKEADLFIMVYEGCTPVSCIMKYRYSEV